MSPRTFALILFAVLAALVSHLVLDHIVPAVACSPDALAAIGDWLSWSFR